MSWDAEIRPGNPRIKVTHSRDSPDCVRFAEPERHQQSPIDIVTAEVTHDPSLKSSKLLINYCVGDAEKVEVGRSSELCYGVSKFDVMLQNHLKFTIFPFEVRAMISLRLPTVADPVDVLFS